MTQPVLISDPARITAAWLTEALNSAGFDGRVNDFDAVSIGTGQVGENVRFSLSGSGDLPATVVGKFASPDPVSRETGISTLNYKREVHFYQHLQSRVNIQTPRCLFTDIDNETHEYIILMEDLAPGEQGDQLGGCNADQAELAMVQLAHLHGPVWGDTSILDDELITSRRANPGGVRELWDMVSPGFLARYADRLTDAEKQMVGQVGEVLDLLNTSYSIDDTLIHIDYRLDNMMFGGPHPLTVVDWQSPAFGCGLNDAAYFMGTSLAPELRRETEIELLQRYFSTLQTYEADLSWDQCWQYYCHHAPAGLIMAVIASMIVGETERGNDMFMAMAKRSAAMSRDLDSVNVIAAGKTLDERDQ